MTLGKDELLIIMNSISDGVITVDLDLLITFINKAALEILEIEEKEALGHNCIKLLNTKKCDNDCPLKETIETGQQVINKPMCLYFDNKRKPISISTAIIRDNNGKVVGGVETFRDLSQVQLLQKELEKKYSFEDIIGKSKAMQKLFEMISLVSQTDSTILIVGESGVGKELIARAIHSLSNRKDKPLITVNCSALPDTLLESELFGYVKGAFTGATKDKKGRFALAEGGTIFLDEIGEISQMVQVKLLRILQEKKYEPLGSTRTEIANVRIITATNRDLEKMVVEKKFRKDFYYRLNVFKIKVPPLRERKDDIPLLIDHFIYKFNQIYNKRIIGISPYALNILMQYDFPGNVRELENFIEHAFVLCQGNMITLEHLPEQFHQKKGVPVIEIANNMSELEAIFLISVLKKHNWNRKKAAEELNINPSTLYRKFKKLGIKPPKK